MIPYKEYMDSFRGYQIFNIKTGKPITKIGYYFIASDENIRSLLAGVNQNYSIRNKPGWDDGYYNEKNDPTHGSDGDPSL